MPATYTLEVEKLPGGGYRGSVVGVSPEPVEHPKLDWLLTFLSGQIVSKEFGSPMKSFFDYLRAAKPKRRKKAAGEDE
jgi:hypothetical protein